MKKVVHTKILGHNVYESIELDINHLDKELEQVRVKQNIRKQEYMQLLERMYRYEFDLQSRVNKSRNDAMKQERHIVEDDESEDETVIIKDDR